MVTQEKLSNAIVDTDNLKSSLTELEGKFTEKSSEFEQLSEAHHKLQVKKFPAKNFSKSRVFSELKTITGYFSEL